MLKLLKLIERAALFAIGWLLGGWIWEAVLKEKCEKLKNRRAKK